MNVIETLNWYRLQALSLAINRSVAIDRSEEIEEGIRILAKDAGSRAEECIRGILPEDYAEKQRCASGHMFYLSPSHPMYQGKPRCPMCMSMRLDRIREQSNEVHGVFTHPRRE